MRVEEIRAISECCQVTIQLTQPEDAPQCLALKDIECPNCRSHDINFLSVRFSFVSEEKIDGLAELIKHYKVGKVILRRSELEGKG